MGKIVQIFYIKCHIIVRLCVNVVLILLYTTCKFVIQCICVMSQGRSQDLGGGGQEFFFVRFGNLHVAKPCVLLGGFGDMFLREIFFKWCNLVRFGVYFDPI